MPRTAFDPQVHGFAFVNSWQLDEVERQQLHEAFARHLTRSRILGAAAFGWFGRFLVSRGIEALRDRLESHLAQGYGLCGGMCFAALDFYKRPDLPFPRGRDGDDQPASGKALRTYLWKRQLDSLASDGARALAWLITLKYLPQVPLFRGGAAWLLDRSREEWAKLKNFVDADKPIPLGLVRDTENVYNNHQVLAIGYDETDEARGTIYLYDPNCPGGESSINITFGERLLDGRESCDVPWPLRGFYCEGYKPSDPTEALG
jgi:hypothetical protein